MIKRITLLICGLVFFSKISLAQEANNEVLNQNQEEKIEQEIVDVTKKLIAAVKAEIENHLSDETKEDEVNAANLLSNIFEKIETQVNE